MRFLSDNSYNDGQSQGARGEEEQRNLIPVLRQPASHPAQQQDPAGHKGRHVEESIRLVSHGGLGLVGDDEQLPGVQEDGVDLDYQGESSVRDVLLTGDSQTVAEDDTEVMDQQLVGAPLPVVDQHVQGVVQEVADGETDENVTRVRELSNQVVPHLRSLQCTMAWCHSSGDFSTTLTW